MRTSVGGCEYGPIGHRWLCWSGWSQALLSPNEWFTLEVAYPDACTPLNGCLHGSPMWLFWRCRGPYEARCVLVDSWRWGACLEACCPVTA